MRYDSELIPYVTGKTVAIVGNAQSIIGKGYGKEIDSADTVIRINLWQPKPEEIVDVGSRTDVNYIGAWIWDKEWGFSHLKPEWESTGKLFGVRTIYKHQDIHSRYVCVTGLVCVIECLEIDCEELRIYGFDFLNTPDRYSKEDKTNIPKDVVDVWEHSYGVFKGIYKEHKDKIVIDGVLEDKVYYSPQDTFLYPYANGKTVSIVGSAESILAHGDGEKIDSSDVVIRVNKEREPDPKYLDRLGKRTDIIYCCTHNYNTMATDGKLLGAIAVVQPRDAIYTKRIIKLYGKLLKDGKSWCPMSGITCAYVCCLSGAKEVYLTGYDFYRTNNYQGGQLLTPEIHEVCLGGETYNNSKKDELALRAMVRQGFPIKMDKVLEKIINEK